MKILTRIFLMLLLLGYTVSLQAGEDGKQKEKDNKLAKTTKNDVFDFISVNNILMWISNNGATAHNPTTDASGLEWPKGSARYAIFTDGLIWGGTVQGEIRVGGATYRYGLQAGPIKGDGTAADPADPRYRIYKVRKASPESFALMTANEQDRMKKDFNEWPVADGAPWKDNNHNGVYDPNFDEWLVEGEATTSDTPFFIGDEILWFVSNDLDASRTNNLYGTSPVGIELHTFVWAYNQTGPLGNMVFTKYTFINKGPNDYENVYVSKWSDPDLGDPNDDFVGIDTVLSLGYTYNGVGKDGVYGIPPATGYDFFQGPMVPGDPTDVALFHFEKRPGFKNLGVSSFAFYINGSSIYADPALGTATGADQMYNYMIGLLWNGNPFVDPITGLTTKVCLAGNPITKEGWIDGISASPGDRRLLMTAGPFTLAKSDSQEVVVATIVGQGSDRLSSLQVLYYYDRFAQLAFDNNFDLPKAPPAPNVKASLQDGKIVLNWGDPVSVFATEKFNDRGYKFQGYNVYQFPSSSSTLADAKRVATFDLVDNVATIFDEVIDNRSGAVVSLPVQFGTDAGIMHKFETTQDALTDKPLVNNQPYYFAVTTYSYIAQDDAPPPRQLESAPKILTLRPQQANPGWRYGANLNDRLAVAHDAGYATGEVQVQVIDPMLLTGHTYEVNFSPVGQKQVEYDVYLDGTEIETLNLDEVGWNLTDVNTGQMVVSKYDKFNGLTTDYFVIDGFQIGLLGAGIYGQFKDPDHTISNEILKVTWATGTIPYIGVNTVGTPTTPTSSWGYQWMTGYQFFGSSLRGYNVKKTVEVRFNKNFASKGYIYLRGASPSYSYQGYFPSKLEVWDVSDPKNAKQLSYAFVENAGTATADNEWDPDNSTNSREYFFIIDESYAETPNPAYEGTFRISADADQMPILYASWYVQRQNFGTKYPWKDGDKWTIVPNVAFSAEDKFSFTTPKASFSKELAAGDISQINVFPNPYLGTNAQELNKYQRFVTFNHLPERANFRIYTVSGTLVRSFSKNNADQTYNWNLLNDNNLPIGSGMYIIHIELPDLGVEKILKLGVVAETQYLDRI